MRTYAADDYATIRGHITKLRAEHGGAVKPVTPLSLAEGAALDDWGKLLDLPRGYYEIDEVYQKRLTRYLAQGAGF